jgi:hypothetical protein
VVSDILMRVLVVVLGLVAQSLNLPGKVAPCGKVLVNVALKPDELNVM